MKQLIACIILGTCVLTVPSFADSWALPSTTEHLSENQQYKLTVVPRDLKRFSDYLNEHFDASKPVSKEQRDAIAPPPMATLQKLTPSQEPEIIWEARLVNDVSPVSVLVPNNGKYVVTFDNWHSVGRGDNVIVIYGAEGKLIRNFALTDLISKRHFRQLPKSVSSTRWAGTHKFSDDGEFVLIEIVDSKSLFSGLTSSKSKTYITKRIRLRDGKVKG